MAEISTKAVKKDIKCLRQNDANLQKLCQEWGQEDNNFDPNYMIFSNSMGFMRKIVIKFLQSALSANTV